MDTNNDAIESNSSALYRIPRAIKINESGAWDTPERAERGPRYQCPACGKVVHVIRPFKRVSYFAHYPGPGTCNGPNVHCIAVEILMEILNGARRGLVNLFIQERGKEKVFAEPGTSATKEVPDKHNGLQFDIVVWNGDVMSSIFEVRSHHRVDDEKRMLMPCRWWEVDARILIRKACEQGMENLRHGLPWGGDLVLPCCSRACSISKGPVEPEGNRSIEALLSANKLNMLQSGIRTHGLLVQINETCTKHPMTSMEWALKAGEQVRIARSEENNALAEVWIGNHLVLTILVAGRNSYVNQERGNNLESFGSQPGIVVWAGNLNAINDGTRVVVNGYSELKNCYCPACLKDVGADPLPKLEGSGGGEPSDHENGDREIIQRKEEIRRWFESQVLASAGPIDLNTLLDEYEQRWLSLCELGSEFTVFSDSMRESVEECGNKILEEVARKQAEITWNQAIGLSDEVNDFSELRKTGERASLMLAGWEKRWGRVIPPASLDSVALIGRLINRAIKHVESESVYCASKRDGFVTFKTLAKNMLSQLEQYIVMLRLGYWRENFLAHLRHRINEISQELSG